jgi:hypothetical protein
MFSLLLLISCSKSTDTSIQKEVSVQVEGDFDSAQNCKDCHPKHYEEWQMSSHAYASQSPVYNAMAQKAYRDTAGQIGDFCSNCHAPTSPQQGESGALQSEEGSSISNEGITCDYCHTATGHDGIIGNNHIMNDTTSGLKYAQYGGLESAHQSERNEFVPSSELCGSCHDVFMFPNIVIDQVYSEYIESPSAAFETECQDCHMSPTPGRTSQRPTEAIAIDPNGEKTYEARERSIHSFIGPDYPLVDTFPYPDDIEASREAQEELQSQIKILLRNAAHIPYMKLERENPNEMLLTVEVESLTPGHRVPTGLTSERQMWLEVTVFDSEDSIVFQSGLLDSKSDLRDSHSEDVKLGLIEKDDQLMNFQSKNMVVAQSSNNESVFEYETIFPFDADQIIRRSLEPMEKREVHYFFNASAAGPYRVYVRLRFRNLPPYLLRALQLDNLIERIKIFEIDEQEQVFTTIQ